MASYAAMNKTKFGTEGPDLEEEANILLGDSINNFKTIQSFAHEDLILEHYKNLL